MKKLLIVLGIAVVLMSSAAMGQSNQTVITVGVAAQASINVSGATSMTNGAAFSNYTGTTNFTYKVRTSSGGTGGTITMSMPNFAQAGGPNVSGLTYSATMGANGTAQAGAANAVTASTSLPVATFATSAHANGEAGSVTWTLADDPAWAVNNYTTTVTYTISAT